MEARIDETDNRMDTDSDTAASAPAFMMEDASTAR
jgi:hypothetical protein